MYVLLAATGILFAYSTAVEAIRSASPGGIVAGRLSVAVLEVGVWFVALICALRLHRYTTTIRADADGVGLHYIAWALLLIVPYVILLSTRNAIAALFVGTRYLNVVVSLRNQVPLVLLFVAACLLYAGSRRLARVAGKKLPFRDHIAACIASGVCFALFAALFYRLEPAALPIGNVPRFTFSLPVLTFTYVLPHLAVWVLSTMAILNIAHYATNAPGKIYKALFRNLYLGLVCVLAGIFISQLGLLSRFAGQQQTRDIFFTYALIIIIGAGFVLLCRGSSVMQRIED